MVANLAWGPKGPCYSRSSRLLAILDYFFRGSAVQPAKLSASSARARRLCPGYSRTLDHSLLRNHTFFSYTEFNTPRYTFCMRRVLFAIVVILSLVPALCAQDDLFGEVSCHRAMIDDPQNQPYAKKLWDGYEISLGPARNGGVDGDGCTAAIFNSGGHVVFRTTGFSVIFDENHTGQDFDGDGKAEVVFITDTGGGNHCCWAYNVISLFPKPHRLFDAPLGTRFENAKLGKMVIWEKIPGLSGLTTSANRPGAEKVFRVSQSKLADATLEFCPRILSPNNVDFDQEQRVLTPEKIKQLAAGLEPDDDTASALLSLALQHTFCRQFDQALYYLTLWPEASKYPGATRKNVVAAFRESIKEEYPDFAERLSSLSAVATAPTRSSGERMGWWLNDLNARETFPAAGLSAAEQTEIIGQVRDTSFDDPDSWESELRVRRISLGEADGLIVRGTRLLCGGTGNCETWVFRHSSGKWLNLFGQEAPIVSGFGFAQEVAGGIKNLLVSANSSAANESRILFKFDGKVYRQNECYEVWVDGAAENIEKVPCK